MLPWVSAAWKEHLRKPASFRADGGHLERFYLDLRQSPRPPLPGDTLAFAQITSGDNQPGSHNLTGGHADYFVALESPTTIHIRVKPTFAYNVGADQPVCAWRVDATHALTLAYNQALDYFVVSWQDGGTARTLAQGAAYTSNGQLQQWIDIDVVFGPAPALAINGAVVDSSWSGAIDALSSTFGVLSLRHDGTGTEGGYTINHARVFVGYAGSAATIASRYKGVLDEEIHWPLDGHGLGRTRCNISDRVTHLSYTQAAKKEETGYASANALDLTLNNRSGIFSDDQYAAFDPSLQQYNGTTGQRYLQWRCALTMESWYGGLHDPVFVGRLDERLFKRRSSLDGSEVQISAEDLPAEIDQVELANPVVYQGKKFSDATEADSLIHLVARLATQQKLENFLSNSSFENAAIANSWTVSGAGATFSRVAGGLLGSYRGDLVYGSAACEVAQTVQFLGDTKLNVGEWYLFAIRAYAAAAAAVTVKIEERDSGGSNDDSSAAFTVGASGWGPLYVAHQVTDAASDRLVVRMSLATNTTLHLDVAMLHRGRNLVEWAVVNATDGAAGAISADSMAQGSFDTCGFDVDPVADVHPCVRIARPWEEMLKLADTTMAFVLGADHAGTLRFRTPFKTGFSDPTPVSVLGATWDLATELDSAQPNTIIVHGVRIATDTWPVQVWSVPETNDEALWVAPYGILVAAGALWPPVATYPEFWAKYELKDLGPDLLQPWKSLYVIPRTPLNPYTRSAKEAELLVVDEDVLTNRASVGPRLPRQQLTQVVFDATTKPDQARIQLRNDLGYDVYLNNCTVVGKRTLQYSGSQGYIHDRFVDHDAVRRDGVVTMELGNNWIMSADLTARCADYLWKDARTKKHEYSFPLAGAVGYYLQPGDWHTARIGTAGTRESVDSTARLLKIVTERGWNTPGETQVTLREVEANWAHDSSAVARGVASGRWPLGRGSVVIVAASTYSGPADYYCTGTNDNLTLQAALDEGDALGKDVATTPGQYNLTAGLHVGAKLLMHPLSIFSHVGADDVITFEADGCMVRDGQISNAETMNYTKLMINFNGHSRCVVQGCAIAFALAAGISCDGDSNKLIDNTAIGGAAGSPFSLIDSGVFNAAAVDSVRTVRLSANRVITTYYTPSFGGSVAARVIDEANGVATVSSGYIPASGTAPWVCALSASKVAMVYRQIDGTGVSVVVGTISDAPTVGEITWGTPVEIDAGTTTEGMKIEALSDTLFVVAYRDTDGTNYGTVVCCTVSGTVPTPGAASVFKAATTSVFSVVRVTATTFIVSYNASTAGLMRAASVSGTTPTWGTEVTFAAAYNPEWGPMAMLDATRGVICRDESSTDHGLATLFSIAGTTITVSATDFEFYSAGVCNNIDVDAVDWSHVLITYSKGATGGYVKAAFIPVSSIVFGGEFEFWDGTFLTGQAAHMANGLLVICYDDAVTEGAFSLVSFTLSPATFLVSGNGNIVSGNHVLGVAGYQQEIGIFVDGDDNKVDGNLVNGLVGAARLISAGIVIGPNGNRNDVQNNKAINCAAKGFVNAGTLTLFGNNNTAFNNGADAGAETI